jgi:transcriptional regulator with XRE-family HTH domain
MKFQEELEIRKQVGERLRAFREELELTQTQLAEQIKVPQFALSRIERGQLPLHITYLTKLRKLGCDLNRLVANSPLQDKELNLLREQLKKEQARNNVLRERLDVTEEKLFKLLTSD